MIFEVSMDIFAQTRSRSPDLLMPQRPHSACSPRLTLSSTNSLNDQDGSASPAQIRIITTREESTAFSAHSVHAAGGWGTLSSKSKYSKCASAPNLEKLALSATKSVPLAAKTTVAEASKSALCARRSIGINLPSANSLSVAQPFRKLSLC